MDKLEKAEQDLRSQDPQIRLSAAKELGAMGDKAAAAAQELARGLEDIWIQKTAFWALSNMPNSMCYCIAELGGLLKSGDDFARESAAQLIGECGSDAKPYLETLRELAKSDPLESVREKSKESFFKIDPDAIL